MRKALALGLARRLVTLASLLAPRGFRERFREEWHAELWYEARSKSARPSSLLLRAAGAFADARAARGLAGAGSPESSRGNRSRLMIYRDFRLALRSMWLRPGWTLVVLATLAVSLGANVAIFSLVRGVLLEPLAYPAPDRLVRVAGLRDGEVSNLSPPDFYDLAEESRTFASMGAHGWVGFFTVTGGDDPERIPGTNVTAGFLDALGVAPVLGRTFAPADDVPEAAPTVILTYPFWQRRFGGETTVVGDVLVVDGVAHEILGVLPEDFVHPEHYPDREPAIYRLFRFDRSGLFRSGRFLRAVGRLGEGRSLDEARAELTAIAERLEAEYPDTNLGRGVHLLPLKEALVGDARGSLLLLFGAVAAVLLVACANLANLQLAQGSRRRQALAIQAALGAGRGRLVSQLAVESWLLAMVGGAFGLLLAFGARRFLALRAIPRADEIAFDGHVVLFALGLASVVSVLFGLAPALQLTSRDRSVVGSGTRATSDGNRARRILIAAEVSLSLVLLVSAGLFMKSLAALRGEGPGFRAESVLTFSTSLPLARYPEGTQIPFYEELERRIAAVAGVHAVGAVNILPLNNNYSRDGFQIESRPALEGEKPSAEARSVSPGYFEAMGVPLLRGRLFDERDRVGSPGVVVISETMARRFWPGGDPIGERITYNRGVSDDGRMEVGGAGSREIVGIVGDVKHLALEDAVVPTFYTPQAHDPSFHDMSFVVRTPLPPEDLVGSVRSVLTDLDEDVPVYAARTLTDLLDGAVTRPRFRTWVLGLFAAATLCLAVVGVYGVVGLLVSQRTHEIGIRMALGAKTRDVVRLLVTESMAPVLWGLVLGLVAAAIASRLLESFLFRVTPHDLETYVGVAALLAASAFLAALLPSLRAAGIDPANTLRE